MSPPADSVLITGTTSGVGRALLEWYVQAGAAVVSVNRRRLPELESRYPQVRFECLDVCSAAGVATLVEELAGAGRLPRLFFLNAGINRVDNDEGFELGPYREVLETNLFGVLNFVAPLTRLPSAGGARHLVAISSLAGYVGNPYGLGYHTSKKALTACFGVWGKMYAGTDLVFQQVLLGPVRTAIYTMADKLPPWMARVKDMFSAPVEGAAAAIARFALTRHKRLIYPAKAIPLYAAVGFGQRLVPGFFQGRSTLAGKRRRPG
jgi:NAD(P)-dependent dehydrogenase (short-subunit alcohol dehydrogenase family)